MRVFTHTEPGGKDLNEDFVLVRRHPQNGDVWICCLADGQGGRSSGAAAAKRACESFFEAAGAMNVSELLGDDVIPDLCSSVDESVSETEGFTTLIALVLDHDSAFGASSGDSKLFALDAIGHVTEATSRQHKNPPVGSGDAIFEPFVARAIEGSRVLMVTDGVWKYAGFESIERALKSADFSRAAAVLKAEVHKRSGPSLPDDFSLIGLEID